MDDSDKQVVTLVSKLTHVRYQKENFVIGVFETTADLPEYVIANSEDPDSPVQEFTALGEDLPVKTGARVILAGYWQPNKRFPGEYQLRAISCVDYVGRSHEEIVAFLSSKALKGIGKKTAEVIYEKFGDETMEVLAQQPERLLEIPGMGKKRLEALVESYKKNQALHTLTLLLAPHGVSYPTIVRIYRKMGYKAEDTIRSNPYSLCRISGFGFMRADDMALKLGLSRHASFRITGALEYTLHEAQGGVGHLYLPEEELLQGAEKVLNANTDDPVTREEILAVLKNRERDETLPVFNTGAEIRVYTPNTLTHEKIAAQKVAEFLNMRTISEDEHTSYLNLVHEVQEGYNIHLDPLQEEAVMIALESRICIITGGPGTGKTTTLKVLVQSVVKELEREGEKNAESLVLLAAPTGRAARRMEEQTNLPASTLHSLLRLRPDKFTDFTGKKDDSGKFSDNDDEEEEEPSPVKTASILIVDEFSMVDAHLMAELMFRVPGHLKLVFVGDADQLPSVGPGNVLTQLLTVKGLPHIKLEKVFRQGEGSVIPLNSQRIRQGNQNLIYNRYFKLIPCQNEAEASGIIQTLFRGPKVQAMLEDIQILAPMRTRGEASTRALNDSLHDIINPPSDEKPEATVGSTLYRLGDKVMQTRNTDSVSNGDIGYIRNLIPPTDGDRESFTMEVEYATGTVVYDYDDALDLVPATAITIHKSQGGEFPFVVIPILRSMSFFLQRNLIYTAITRAKKQVVLVGQEDAIRTAIWHVDSTRRNSSLAELIDLFRQNTDSILF